MIEIRKKDAIELTKAFLQDLKNENLEALQKYGVDYNVLQEIKETLASCEWPLSDLEMPPVEKALSGETDGGREIFELFLLDDPEVMGIDMCFLDKTGEDIGLTLSAEIIRQDDGQLQLQYRLLEVQ